MSVDNNIETDLLDLTDVSPGGDDDIGETVPDGGGVGPVHITTTGEASGANEVAYSHGSMHEDSSLSEHDMNGTDSTYGVDDVDEWEDDEDIVQESPYDLPGAWYVVHTYAGYENIVKANLVKRAGTMNMEDNIYDIVIPLEEVVEYKNSKKVIVQKKVFPGYLLCRCEMDDDTWSMIRNTPAVTGFVGSGTRPTPLSRSEIEAILKPSAHKGSRSVRNKAQLEYELGDTVRVKAGSFADFSGQVAEINEDQLKLKVLVNIFGRETPVELDLDQVAKL
ncbi:MAG: transcription termination/antitermination protein NusG [Actinobacteria bacterium]|jgi:transcriptional antiterminator NusG|nr:transcription termination/antitermination protein NusG [Actinomycetota bacterium]MCL5885753.1 transcription termination/antitermination protein NusG [Actinomycetota bacterium]